MFYVIVFALLAVLLVVAGLTMQARNRRRWQAESQQERNAARSRRRKPGRPRSAKRHG